MPSIPHTSSELVLLTALVQARAHQVIAVKDELIPTDFTPAGATIFHAILQHAQDAAQQDRNARMNLPVINAALSEQGAFHGHDNGTQALMNEIATTESEPLWIPRLTRAVRLESWRRAFADYLATIAEIDPETIGVTESDQLLQHAQNKLQQARGRIETATPNKKAGNHLAAV